MMKYFLLAFVVAVAAASSARAQSFSAPVDGNRPQQKEHPVPPPSTGKAVGAFPRVFARGGNPLQLINPRARRSYYDASTTQWLSVTAPCRRRIAAKIST